MSKNTRRAAMDAERLDWQCFRFVEDKRQWKAVAPLRRSYFIKAANSANQDGTHVEISVATFKKAAGEKRSAFRRLDELADMGVMLPVLHIDRDGNERELLGPLGTKVRRLRFEPLVGAQKLLDSGEPFLGHKRMSKEEQLEIQRGWLQEDEPAASTKGVSNSRPKECQTHPKECQSHPKEVPNSPKGMPHRVAHNRSCSTEVLPTDQPSNQQPLRLAGGMVGNHTSADMKNADKKNEAVPSAASQVLTLPDQILRMLQRVHHECVVNSTEIDVDGFPKTLTSNRAQIQTLMQTLSAYDNWHAAIAEAIPVIGEAYRVWFGERLLSSWREAANDAQHRAKPIHWPFAIFAKEVLQQLDTAYAGLNDHNAHHHDGDGGQECWFCSLWWDEQNKAAATVAAD